MKIIKYLSQSRHLITPVGWMGGWMDGQTVGRVLVVNVFPPVVSEDGISLPPQEVPSHSILLKQREQQTISFFPANGLSTSICSLDTYFLLSFSTCHRIFKRRDQQPMEIIVGSYAMEGELSFPLCLILRMWSYPPVSTSGIRPSVKTVEVFP